MTTINRASKEKKMHRSKLEITTESNTLKDNPLLSDATRKVDLQSLNEPLSKLVQNIEGIDSFDILIKNESDDIVAVVIDAAAYNFFLKKVEEAEDEHYSNLEYERYTGNEVTLEELKQQKR